MIVYKCDRCYRLFNPVARMYPRYVIYKQTKQGKQLLNIDLCPDCEEELKNWFEATRLTNNK